ALSHFGDGSIDLLHLDGGQNYEAAWREFLGWLPKVSDRGVVLLHGTNLREGGCGVWKLLQEGRARHPSFEFPHPHGLGVLAGGANCPERLARLAGCAGDEAARVQAFYAQLGQRISQLRENRRLESADATRQHEQRQTLVALWEQLAAAEQAAQVLRLQ